MGLVTQPCAGGILPVGLKYSDFLLLFLTLAEKRPSGTPPSSPTPPQTPLLAQDSGGGPLHFSSTPTGPDTGVTLHLLSGLVWDLGDGSKFMIWEVCGGYFCRDD